jgi:hypothetical protein
MTPLALTLKDNVLVNAPLEFIKAQKLMEVEKLSKTMTKIHAQVAEKAMSDAKAAIPKHSDKDAHAFANFQVGNYVLVAQNRKSGTSELQVKWKDPRRITSVESDYMFVVESLLTMELKAAHEHACNSIRRRNITSQRSWLKPPSTTTMSCSSRRRYSARATMNKTCFMSGWLCGAVFKSARLPGNRTLLWLWLFLRWGRSS